MSNAGYEQLGTEDPDRLMSLPPDRIVFQRRGRPTHRTVVALHLIFKIMAIFIYIFAGFISNSFIGCFITIMMLLSADFWIVKNVSGRLLAGLRWWSSVNDEGKVKWIYESWTNEERDLAKSAESSLFWASLIASQSFWLLFAVSALFSLKLKWLTLCALAVSLNGANVLGYVRCRMGNVNMKEAFTGWAAKVIIRKKPEQEQNQQNQNF